MPRGSAPQWRRRKEPVLDHYIHASVSQAGGVPNSEGHYTRLVYTGCDSRDRAKEIEDALYRCARYLGFSITCKIKSAGDGAWNVEFLVIDKTYARKYQLETHGSDRSEWAYDPRRKGSG